MSDYFNSMYVQSINLPKHSAHQIEMFGPSFFKLRAVKINYPKYWSLHRVWFIPQSRLDRFLGELSYPTDVILFPIIASLQHLRWLDYMITSMLGSLGAGLLIQIMVELPMRAMLTQIRLGRPPSPNGAAIEPKAS